ncbi:MAG: S26 family signal peptidase [Candidatus Aenigmarchaeota archaeon]|nr:S26 family signal peptidase [Candidatus Aenigmarchaeota archaeon]
MFPLMRFKIRDKSMEPSFGEGDYVVANKLAYLFRKPKIGDVVVAKHDGSFIIKRITKTKGGRYFVCGDNGKYSSRLWIGRKNIVGRVWFHLKKSAKR